MNRMKIFNSNSLKLFLVLTLLFISFSGCGKKDDSSTKTDDKETLSDDKKQDKDLKFSPGSKVHVKFEISGPMKGTVDAYYHDKKSKSTSMMEMAGQKISASAFFDGGEYVYIISEAAGMKTGMKYKSDEYNKSKKEGEFDALTFKENLANMDKIGTEVILDKECDIYRSKDGKYQISIYKETVPLKFSSNEGKMIMVAKEFDSDADFSDDIFTPPADTEFMDATEMMNGMKDMKNMKNKMKNLEDKTKEMEDMMKKYNK